MKKIITFVAAMAFATTAFSQFSIHAGGNVSQFTGKDALGSTKLGYQIGITTYSNKLFSVQPGLFLINKGAKHGSVTTNLNYLQLPVNLMLGYNINEDLRLVAGAGLYAALGLWGNVETNQVNKIEFFSQNDPFKAFDLGWQFVLGAQWGRYGVRLSYQPGFTRVNGNWNPDKNDYSNRGPHAFNNSFKFGVSYTFGDMEGAPPRR